MAPESIGPTGLINAMSTCDERWRGEKLEIHAHIRTQQFFGTASCKWKETEKPIRINADASALVMHYIYWNEWINTTKKDRSSSAMFADTQCYLTGPLIADCNTNAPTYCLWLCANGINLFPYFISFCTGVPRHLWATFVMEEAENSTPCIVNCFGSDAISELMKAFLAMTHGRCLESQPAASFVLQCSVALVAAWYDMSQTSDIRSYLWWS